MAFPKRINSTHQPRKQLVVIGSKNPVKIKCVEEAFHLTFSDAFIVQGLNVDSGVANQPLGDEETYRGASNRANNCKAAFPEADFWVGIEGGVEWLDEEMSAYAWIVLMDRSGRTGQAKTASFFLPPIVAKLVKEGKELGEVNDQVFQTSNSKQQGGAVGILTKGVVGRKELYKQAVLLSLIPFVNPEMYQ